MNETVKRIVELMFEDTVMSEEATALKDELMNNCQERYADLVARGMTEDEAIAVVVDSLKGMEEVINEFPKVKKEPEIPLNHNGEAELTFDPAQVKVVDIHLIGEDVEVDTSDDNMIHVVYDGKQLPYVRASVDGGVLRVGRDEQAAREFTKNKEHIHNNLNVRINGKDIFSAINDVVNAAKNLSISIDVGLKRVSVLLPACWQGSLQCRTINGDVRVENARLEEISIATTSADVNVSDTAVSVVSVETINGDVNVDVHEAPVSRVKVKTTSGDIQLSLEQCRETTIQTMSGDVDLSGEYEELTVNTVSGDVELAGEFAVIHGKTTSGDLTISDNGTALRCVDASTVSGDVELNVADNSISANVRTHTISGDVTNRLAYRGEPSVKVNIQTMSGDITVE